MECFVVVVVVRICHLAFATMHIHESNAYFIRNSIQWKYEIAHSIHIDNWNRVIYNQTLFAFAYLYFSASERQTEKQIKKQQQQQQQRKSQREKVSSLDRCQFRIQ